jgi:hypothetical protein
MKNIYAYAYAGVALAATILLTSGVIAVRRYGDGRFEDGRNAVLADDARTSAQLHADRDALDHFSALATGTLTTTLGTQLPAIQGQTHDTLDTIRTVYRDRPADDVACSRPDGVQAALNEAVDRANQAAHGQL